MLEPSSRSINMLEPSSISINMLEPSSRSINMLEPSSRSINMLEPLFKILLLRVYHSWLQQLTGDYISIPERAGALYMHNEWECNGRMHSGA